MTQKNNSLTLLQRDMEVDCGRWKIYNSEVIRTSSD